MDVRRVSGSGRGGADGGGQRAVEFKVVVLGDKGVGKTSLVLRFIEGFWHPKQQSTIGAFFLSKQITASDGTICKMQIWDTAGQERFRAVAPMYYRNAAAAIVCFDITAEDSFNKMKDWVEELKTNIEEGKIMIVISCNKTDLEESRVVSRARAEQFASGIGAVLCESSAKENWGVTEVFQKVCEHVIETRGPELFEEYGARQGDGQIRLGGDNDSFGLSPAARAAGFADKKRQDSSPGCCS